MIHSTSRDFHSSTSRTPWRAPSGHAAAAHWSPVFVRQDRCSLVDMVDILWIFYDFYDYDIDYDYCDYDWWIIYDNTIMIMIMIYYDYVDILILSPICWYLLIMIYMIYYVELLMMIAMII